MKKYLLTLLIGLGMTIGSTAALAGGSSDTSGEGYHCYLFFCEFDGMCDSGATDVKFAQVMVNDDKEGEVQKKVKEFLFKYLKDEEMYLKSSVGNIESPWDTTKSSGALNKLGKLDRDRDDLDLETLCKPIPSCPPEQPS